MFGKSKRILRQELTLFSSIQQQGKKGDELQVEGYQQKGEGGQQQGEDEEQEVADELQQEGHQLQNDLHLPSTQG